MISRGRFSGRDRSAPARSTVASTLLFLLALVGAAPAQAATGSISGTVIAAADKAPIQGIEVCAWSLTGGTDWGCSDTDSAGDYAIGTLEPDEYAVEFWPAGQPYGYRFYDGKTNWLTADPVTVGTGETSGIDAELPDAASIEGTVTASATGLPVEEVEVCAYDAGEGEISRCTETAADGSYSLAPLQAGEYKIEFWPGFTGQNLGFEYFDDETRWEDADVVTVGEAETVSGIDASLGPGTTITGTVTRAATGAPLEEIPVCAIESATGELWTCTWTAPNGSYSLRSLSAGTYKVVFSIDFGEWYGEPEFSEDDGFPTEFWNEQSTLAAANPIGLATGATAAGIDAKLGPSPVPPVLPVAPAVTPPAATPLPIVPRVHRPRKCKRGFKRRMVRGKRRCVRIKRHRARRKGAARKSAQASGAQATGAEPRVSSLPPALRRTTAPAARP